MCDVQDVLNRHISDTGEELTFNRLRGDVECCRNKPMLIEIDTMPVGMSGYVVSLRDVDLICINPDLDEILRQIVTLHEMSHLLLDHVMDHIDDGSVPTYDEFKRNRDVQSIMCREYNDAYDTATEQNAESLARALLRSILRRRDTTPSFARDLYE